MKINSINNNSFINNRVVSSNKRNTTSDKSVQTNNQNTIVQTKNYNTVPVSFTGFFSILSNKHKTETKEDNEYGISYDQKLSKDLNRVMGADIPAKNLKNIISGEELRLILPQLSTQNFISSAQNQEAGIYGVDLDYITSYSYNGNDDLFDVLDNAAQYSNFYHKRTGKNFIFAITDNDTVEGITHALRYIGDNPDQFKHLSFVPGVKMSFAHKAPNSNIGYENSRMLIYGINPFSDNINSFVNGVKCVDGVDGILTKRQAMVYDFIKEASKLYKSFIYKIPEFTEQNAISLKKDFGQSDLYWRVREYISSKGDTEVNGFRMTPKEIYTFAEDIFAGMDTVYKGSDNKSPFSIIIGDEKEANILIKKLFDKYSTHYNPETRKIESAAETIYGNLIDCMAKENPKPIMALSAPYYFSHHFEKPGVKEFANVAGFMHVLQKKSNGMLVGFESVVPSYDLDKNLTTLDIENFNSYIKNNTNLVEVGGSFATRDTDELPFRG